MSRPCSSPPTRGPHLRKQSQQSAPSATSCRRSTGSCAAEQGSVNQRQGSPPALRAGSPGCPMATSGTGLRLQSDVTEMSKAALQPDKHGSGATVATSHGRQRDAREGQGLIRHPLRTSASLASTALISAGAWGRPGQATPSQWRDRLSWDHHLPFRGHNNLLYLGEPSSAERPHGTT